MLALVPGVRSSKDDEISNIKSGINANLILVKLSHSVGKCRVVFLCEVSLLYLAAEILSSVLLAFVEFSKIPRLLWRDDCYLERMAEAHSEIVFDEIRNFVLFVFSVR